ncbi:ParB/RepB/Spo0J family partition protein [Pseudooceanicola sediminis]|uniref:ParB/RepB/Spo0J family partition protein n=1 Tax=Pseudooceanicola sediminis TaxID=2211117 RepID=A0A399J572_9RHOB|nr:ParB/RepB/Spo0J family partition protein [Pseudooceanicola sediminis]KAA2315444.1 ParB/RepB/Spo0J family partition protein [Puniceibacterium sp. HSS470]RII40350.1 ParB/RepB/Spo0J family partition protein [Pseudooceanicola sediminis]|tara:strand:+ start:44179 stop:45084 length:906 start_codon:yes stop_codon:yes gene_type:complete
MEKKKTRGLGRGLSALMADVTHDDGMISAGATRRPDMLVPIENVVPNPDQPRRTFTSSQLEELASSIREKGVIQPLIVRPRPGASGEYEIVAGERRWRAAQMAKLHELPVIVRDFNDIEVLEVAIIENIQRADLNPIEEAAGFKQLMEKFGHTQEKLAQALGKSRSHIANLMRLLQLPDEVREMLQEGQLSAGHARALITSDDPVMLARRVVDNGLSVRATEQLAKKPESSSRKVRVGAAASKALGEKDADTKALESDLSAALGMKIEIDHVTGQEAGKLSIRYDSLEQLDELCQILSSAR